jgi:hypothetical protein
MRLALGTIRLLEKQQQHVTAGGVRMLFLTGE